MLRSIDTKLTVSLFLAVNKIDVKYSPLADPKHTAVHAF